MEGVAVRVDPSADPLATSVGPAGYVMGPEDPLSTSASSGRRSRAERPG
jgi:hypothetical protein